MMGGMAVAALAEDQWMNDTYGPAEPSVSSQPENGLEQPNAGEIREPVETGAVPDRPEGLSNDFKEDTGEAPMVEIGGRLYRPNIDTGP